MKISSQLKIVDGIVIFKNFTIRYDANTDMYCMTDAWKAVNGTVQNRPNEWLKLESTHKLLLALCENHDNFGLGNFPMRTKFVRNKDLEQGLVKTKNGGRGSNASATFCVWQVLLAYMTYLDEKFFADTINVFDKAMHSDVELILSIYKNASVEEKKRIASRLQGKESRRHLTDTLKEHGVDDEMGYSTCTNATYLGLYNKRASELKEEMGLNPREELRDNFSSSEISTIALAEDLTVRKIRQDNVRGTDDCSEVCYDEAKSLKEYIDSRLKPKLKQE